MFNITFPTFVLGSMIAWLIGAMVHLIAGGKLIRLIFCLVFAWLGFWGGNYLGNNFGLHILLFGQINYAPALILCVVASLFGFWLSGENHEEEE
jgi:hypothetical protein